MGQAQGSILFTFSLIVFYRFPCPHTPQNKNKKKNKYKEQTQHERLSGQIVGHYIEVQRIKKLGIVVIKWVGLKKRLGLANWEFQVVNCEKWIR